MLDTVIDKPPDLLSAIKSLFYMVYVTHLPEDSFDNGREGIPSIQQTSIGPLPYTIEVEQQQRINSELKTIVDDTETLLRSKDVTWWLENYEQQYKAALRSIARAMAALSTISPKTIAATERTITLLSRPPPPTPQTPPPVVLSTPSTLPTPEKTMCVCVCVCVYFVNSVSILDAFPKGRVTCVIFKYLVELINNISHNILLTLLPNQDF